MERRAVPRKPVLMSGSIQFAGGAIICLVRDMSISGAALEVAEPYDIPERFNLVYKADGTHTRVYRSRANFRRAQCGSFGDELNCLSTSRFNARITPILANIVGPPLSATSNSASIAACHFSASCSILGSCVM